ncbi:hypothetical protein D3C72_249320 [compost metagenome]
MIAIVFALAVASIWPLYGAVMGAWAALNLFDEGRTQYLQTVFWMYVVGGFPALVVQATRGIRGHKLNAK